MANIFDEIGNVAGSIGKEGGRLLDSVSKEFNRVLADKDMMNVIMVAATIYTVGGAAGWWGAGNAAAAGSAGLTGSAATEAALVNSATADFAAGSSIAEVAGQETAKNFAMDATTQGITDSLAAEAAGGTLAQQAGGGAAASEFAAGVTAPSGGFGPIGQAPGVDVGMNNLVSQAPVSTTPGGFGGGEKISSFGDKVYGAAKSIGSFIQDNPMAGALAFQTAAGAFSPDEIDIMRERQKIEEEAEGRRRRRANENTLEGGTIARYMRPRARTS